MSFHKLISCLPVVGLAALYLSTPALAGQAPTSGVDVSADLDSIVNLIIFITKWAVNLVLTVGVFGLVTAPLVGFFGGPWKMWLGLSFACVAVKILVATLLALALGQ